MTGYGGFRVCLGPARPNQLDSRVNETPTSLSSKTSVSMVIGNKWHKSFMGWGESRMGIYMSWLWIDFPAPHPHCHPYLEAFMHCWLSLVVMIWQETWHPKHIQVSWYPTKYPQSQWKKNFLSQKQVQQRSQRTYNILSNIKNHLWVW